MSRTPKTAEILENEKKSHKSAKEIEDRKEVEKSLLTGIKIRKFKEVKKNKIANSEFNRVQKLLEAIEKNDDLYSNVINRYCILKAECEDFENKRESFYLQIEKLEEEYDSGNIEPKEYFRLVNAIQRNVVDMDKQIQNKRKMMFDIEKENLMTVAAALRSVPKAASTKDDELEEIKKFVVGRGNE